MVKLCVPDDKLLVKRSKAGEMDAFEELVRRYERKIYALAYQYVGNHDDANDIAQDAFINAYKTLTSFRGESSFSTWLYRITINACMNQIRRQIKRNRLILDIAMTPHRENPLLFAELSPEDHVEREELRELLRRCIKSLSRGHRLVLLLREVHGLSYNEISYCLGCPLNTVKVKLHRARRALKKRILEKRDLLAR